jgi:pyridoxamine 5'-phosphate oxidase family protein
VLAGSVLQERRVVVAAAGARNDAAGARVEASMSVFTERELEYLAGQRLGRIATAGPDGQPHVVPTSFRHNPEHDAIEVGGLRMSQTKKVRDVRHGGRAAIVVDDVLPPWQPRMIEIRGTAEVVPSGGKAFGDNFEDTVIRIHPRRIISFGINPGDQTANARSVDPA